MFTLALAMMEMYLTDENSRNFNRHLDSKGRVNNSGYRGARFKRFESSLALVATGS